MAKKMIFGYFKTRDEAERALENLKEVGITEKELSVMMRDGKTPVQGTSAEVAEGAVGGALTGGAVGGLAGLLVGIGAVALPGLGGVLIAGPLAAALGLTGAAATTTTGALTGALAGGLIGALVGLGLSEEDAQAYETAVKQGGILLAVEATSQNADDISDVLAENGAERIRENFKHENTTGSTHQHEGYGHTYQHQIKRGTTDSDEKETK